MASASAIFLRRKSDQGSSRPSPSNRQFLLTFRPELGVTALTCPHFPRISYGTSSNDLQAHRDRDRGLSTYSCSAGIDTAHCVLVHDWIDRNQSSNFQAHA
jgi:hypothetical protein